MFYADLHVHSKFSRATSRDCDLEHLALWAGKKGIGVVATGDFTHPGWLAEIEEKLVPAEPGLFRLRPELEKDAAEGWHARSLRRACSSAPSATPFQGVPPVRFMLQVEISTIYKKDGRTRKVHHLIYVPGIDHARRLIQSLSRIGNLGSDGRPILGLDSRNLLEITLQSGEGSYLVPAHVWTPWFSVLGSKSGFDSIEDCYGDLAGEIFALETGLSSDPPMNWRVSRLDRFALVSNSDAHSPPRLGREACAFDTEVDYFAMRRALETGEGYRGTIELFPEEGKYHLDGHRKCGVCLSPDESRKYGGKCPACGKALTLGVLYRVCELADRPEPPQPPPRAAPFRSLIPLEEVLAEVCGVGAQTRTVQERYEKLLAGLGSELFILEHAPAEDVARAGSPLLAEAVLRMRAGRVIRQAGYDGEYGVIRLFAKEELRRGTAVGLLFALPEQDVSQPPAGQHGHEDVAMPPAASKAHGLRPVGFEGRQECLFHSAVCQLDPQQQTAVEMVQGPVLIVAGPGTGKTRTLVHRIARLIADHGIPPEQCLALTFSRRAAGEMIERLERLLPTEARRVPVMTFHALGLSILREHGDRLALSRSLRVASESERAALRAESPDAYHREMAARGWVDFDDLIALPLRLLEANPDLVDHYRSRYRWVSVDEYQDIDATQYRLLRLLVPDGGNLCVIGDPDQAIYGFRGADVAYFQQFRDDFPTSRTVVLERNYRSTQTIVDAALQLIAPASLVGDRRLEARGLGPEQVEIHACTTDRAEAEFVVHAIERLIGGSTFFSLDSRRVASDEGQAFGFSDFAILYRTQAQAEPLVEALGRSGMPFQRRSHNPLGEEPAVKELIRAMEASKAHGLQPVGFGDATQHDHEDVAMPPVSVLELLDRAVKQIASDDPRLDLVLPALRSLAARCGNDMPLFLSELALGMEVDLWDPRADRVSLLTLHAAKGLEFPVVFIVGCEDGILPLRFGPARREDERALVEERRLFFVGMTRARERLILTHARKRRWQGKVRPASPSPFLDDIERRLLELHQHRAVRKPAVVDPQRSMFES